jgi:hypothetical protein
VGARASSLSGVGCRSERERGSISHCDRSMCQRVRTVLSVGRSYTSSRATTNVFQVINHVQNVALLTFSTLFMLIIRFSVLPGLQQHACAVQRIATCKCRSRRQFEKGKLGMTVLRGQHRGLSRLNYPGLVCLLACLSGKNMIALSCHISSALPVLALERLSKFLPRGVDGHGTVSMLDLFQYWLNQP